jgi:crotonobetainyl-CoA:carnitine CoA-transferase CaiB-like acyl-CoA transferase
LAEWTRTQDAEAVMQRLQRAGVAAGVASDGRDLVLNEQLRSRGFFSWLDHPEHSGIGPKPYPGVPWRFSASKRGLQRRAPALGEHTRVILHDLLGYDAARLASLEDCGALSVDPSLFPRPSPVPLDELLRQGRVLEVDPAFEERIRPPS